MEEVYFEVETEVGVLKVTEAGARTSKCKVSKGGKEILQLFDKNNRESLICELNKKYDQTNNLCIYLHFYSI